MNGLRALFVVFRKELTDGLRDRRSLLSMAFAAAVSPVLFGIMFTVVAERRKSADEIVINSLEWYRRNEIDLRVGVRIVDVDPVRKTVTGDDGSVTPYDSLLLATGSTAWMPPIKGLDKEGVLTFRTLDDTRELIKRSGPDTQAVVIGGGLCGLVKYFLLN